MFELLEKQHAEYIVGFAVAVEAHGSLDRGTRFLFHTSLTP
jgi:hypothetical protein